MVWQNSEVGDQGKHSPTSFNAAVAPSIAMVTNCYNNVTGVAVAPDVSKVTQICYSGVGLVLHWCHSGVAVVLQWCYNGDTMVIQWLQN
jgi:hypothetical protein